MAFKNDNIKDLFDRNSSAAEVLNENNRVQEDDGIDSWDKFFDDVFAKPLEHPRNTVVLIRRHLPIGHPLNNTEMDLQIPFMFTTDDEDGERWLAVLYDSKLDHGGWEFLFMKPDRDVLLSYIAGKEQLSKVYETAVDSMYLIKPDVSRDFFKTTMDELPDSALPAEDSIYDNDIWIDPNDIHFGMNVEDTYNKKTLAEQKLFFKK